MSDLISFERLTGSKEELQALQQVLTSVPSYSIKTTGEEPSKTIAKEIFERPLPEGVTAENRYLFGVFFNHKMIGCIDMYRSYPDEKTVTMTLLLINDDVQGAGLGSEAFKEAENIIKEWKDYSRLRLEMVRTLEQVMPFWRKMGFRKTNESLPYEVGTVKSRTVVLEKSLFRGPGQSAGPKTGGPTKKSKFQRNNNNKNFSQRRNNNDQERPSPQQGSTDDNGSTQPPVEVADYSGESES